MPKKASEDDHLAPVATSGEGRYRQLEELLELAIELQASHTGMTYAQISERWQCSDKTAKRRVKALRNVFGDALVAERNVAAPSLRFRLRHPLVAGAAGFTNEEFAALAAAADAARQLGDSHQASALARVAEKAHALMEAMRS
jgi:predicted DNA-binding transcriptional regulator YafY